MTGGVKLVRLDSKGEAPTDVPPVVFRFQDCRVRWAVFLPLLFLHVGAVAALFDFSWVAFGWAAGLWFLTGILGITACYHRMLSHRAFDTYRWIKLLHLSVASLTFQQGPLSWVRLHRSHHAYSDTPQDPHPQQYGFFFGHMGWSFLSHKTIGRSPEVRALPADLASDPMMIFFEKMHVPLFLLSLLAIYFIGGWEHFLWAGCFRTVWVMHVTWGVNSLAHRFGYRSFETKDMSTNNVTSGLLAFGEGWHNNHHRFPTSAKFGLKLFEIDLSWCWISVLSKLNLAWNIQRVRPDGKGMALILEHSSRNKL